MNFLSMNHTEDYQDIYSSLKSIWSVTHIDIFLMKFPLSHLNTIICEIDISYHPRDER